PMRIKIWASVEAQSPDSGPYKMLDVVERDTLYAVGEMTHYGAVILVPSPITPYTEDVDQSVIVKLNPASLATRPDESVVEKPPSSYNKIEFFPILVNTHGYLNDDPPLTGTHTILAVENLSIE